MDAKLFIETYKRMCHAVEDCIFCPLYVDEKDGCAMDGFKEGTKCTDDILNAVEKWYNEHPLKTRLNEAKKLFVNLPLTSDGKYPMIDPCQVDSKIRDECATSRFFGSCDKCRNDYWNSEIKED